MTIADTIAVPRDPDRKQLDRLCSLFTCSDEEALAVWDGVLDIFEPGVTEDELLAALNADQKK